MKSQPESERTASPAPVAQRLVQVLDGLPDVIAIYDREWRVTFLNAMARSTFQELGVDAGFAIGKVLWDLVPQIIGSKFETETRRAAGEQRIVEYEEYLPDLDKWFETRVIPVENGGVIAFARDVTERMSTRRALEESEARFRHMVDAIPNLAWIANADGWIFWYNRRWYEYTGTTPEQMEGWGWQSVHDPAVLPSVLERWTKSIETAEPFNMEFPLRGADGSFRPFLTRVVPVRDSQGQLVRWVGTNTDVSEQQAAVAQQARLLESERIAREAAEEANQAKSQFLATMSHELRTPLNAIAGYADLLDAGIVGELNEQQRNYVQRVHRSQQILLGLINDILNYAKLEAGRVQYDPEVVLVKPLFDVLATIVEVQTRLAGIAFVCDASDSVTVYADPDKLQQILINLCSNAIKAMPKGGSLTITCSTEEGQTVFAVTDTGVGIAANKIEAIFEPFVQLDRELTTPKDGTGLGLAISRDLAHAMGGTLVARSIMGAGSTFTLRLPTRPLF